jgi:putative phosphoesterase
MTAEVMSMRIAAVSDIHVRNDGSDQRLLEAIRDRVESLSPDVFIIAGDISDKLRILSDSLEILYQPDCKNLYVAGNHDIWFEEDTEIGSLEKYSNKIGEVCEKNNFIHLPDSPYIVDKMAFVGSIGWYDYSLRRQDLQIPDKAYQDKEYKGEVWFDLFSVDWEFTDPEATELFNQKIEYDLVNLPRNIERVVFVSHHIPFRELSHYKGRLPWDFFSAFMGAESTGETLQKDSRVFLSISGHSHVRKRAKIGDLVAVTVPLGYGRPSDDELEGFVKSTVAEIVIEDENVEIPNFVEGDICAGLPYGDYA